MIHQPNLFPRLSTLAKLFAADRWIVLDDVQFARRDYQNRTRLAALDDPSRQQWLTLPACPTDARHSSIRLCSSSRAGRVEQSRGHRPLPCSLPSAGAVRCWRAARSRPAKAGPSDWPTSP
ncbi:WbqC family protein [Streptomyces hokutonensis]|uniref:WbqC family protein n=1 Tax=Streptomyces hokutonensis TaxID=1306990 RepID=UPI0033C3E3C4